MNVTSVKPVPFWPGAQEMGIGGMMNIFSGRNTVLGVLAVVVAGLAIGVGLARLVGHGAAGDTRATGTTRNVAVHSIHASTPPAGTKSQAPAGAPVAVAPPTTKAIPTPAAASTPGVISGVAQAVAQNALQGGWEIDEDNVQVGTITWSGQAVASGDSIVFDVHKVRVAGKPATSCERRTVLHAVLSARSIDQGASYTETNCEGVSSTGEIRVSSFSPDARSVIGSFWNGQQKLGDFHAQRL